MRAWVFLVAGVCALVASAGRAQPSGPVVYTAEIDGIILTFIETGARGERGDDDGRRLVDSAPVAIAGQPRFCGSLGVPSVSLNHCRTSGWNGLSAEGGIGGRGR